MGMLLGVYYLLLQRENLYRFNRFYLLFSLVFSLALPFITIEVYKKLPAEVIPQHVVPATISQSVQQSPVTVMAVATADTTNYLLVAAWAVYVLLVVVFTVRFVVIISQFKKRIRRNAVIPYKEARLVPDAATVLPHTFLSYIFLNKAAYENNEVEDELYEHELAHVQQKHTLDILFTELLKTVFWFNPLLYLYKRAIQLNHEFLADEQAAASAKDIASYQKLVLEKAAFGANGMAFSSNFNFSITKKRLIMMTKKTNKARGWLLKAAVLPVLGGTIYLLCTKTVAQVKEVNTKNETSKNVTVSKQSENNIILSDQDKKRDAYFSGVKVNIVNMKEDIQINKPYEELTLAEKRKYLSEFPVQTQKKEVTEKLFEDLKDKNKYAVWVDYKNVDNQELSKYKASDFSGYFGSFVHKNARTQQHPQLYQYTLVTNGYFDKENQANAKHYAKETHVVIWPGSK